MGWLEWSKVIGVVGWVKCTQPYYFLIGKSDHAMLKCAIDIAVVRSNNKRMRPNFNKADRIEVLKTMHREWSREKT